MAEVREDAPTAPASLDVVRDGSRTVVRVRGDLTLATSPALFERIDRDVGRGKGPATLDLSGVGRCDSVVGALVLALRERLGDLDVVGANEQVESVLRLADRVPPRAPRPPRPPRHGFFWWVGHTAHDAAEVVVDTFAFIGELTAALAHSLLHPRSVRWRDVVDSMGRTGADAIGIVALIGFLIGWILAFQGAAQLGRFGIEVYTADAVGVTVVAELGPLMTAIIVAGRSGAAFAAEIGTMKVNEEVDALDTMGLDRMRFLVAPKVIALCAMMPLLVLFANACGVLGGLLVGVSSLDMAVSTYFRHIADSVSLTSLAQGMIKGEAYAIVIAAIGCLRGLQTRQGAQGVGLSTTSAVVTGILFIILVDALLTTVFHYVW